MTGRPDWRTIGGSNASRALERRAAGEEGQEMRIGLDTTRSVQTLVAAGVAAALLLFPAGAEAAAGGKTGAKIRIELKGAVAGGAGAGDKAGEVAGELVAVRKDALVIALEGGDSRAVAVADIAKIEVHRRTRARTGILFGAVIGGAGGIAMSAGKSEEGVTFLDGLSTHVIVGGAGMLIGGALGAIVGGQFGGDKTYDLTVLSEAEVEKMMAALRKRARVKDYQ